MSDSLEPNVSAPAVKTAKRQASTKKRSEPQRPSLPDWAPWGMLVGLIAVCGVGSRVVQAAVASSEGHQASETTKPAAPASTAPTPAPKASARAAGAASGQLPSDDQRISALHLVVTHKDSVMGQKLNIMRTREQAQQRAGEALARARKGEDFSKLITEYTEEPYTEQTHGELKNFQRKDAIPSVADAVFKLKVGELSGLVDTPYGYMVLLRTQ
jgi:hypothetical protein